MIDLNNFFSQISDDKPVRLFLPVLGADERLLIQCVLKKTQTTHFNLLFNPGALPVNKIDLDTSCLINLDLGGKSVSLEGKIIQVVNDQTLDMVPLKTISHEQMREYFRVDCTVPIVIKSLIPEGFGIPEDTWKIMGTTVDLSGSGLRASFTTAPPARTQVRLELALPTVEMTVVPTLASPVRISQLTDNLWDAAYHFDHIEDEDRDKIIGCCLMSQRRLLRLKVQVKGS
ncbi:MAG: PilZ domain-containing protein [Proteobacteria bacterium]|nr:PilZ domain-containing protein [Pseudomonadota bacterium]MBU1233936.1 PilZ domain-containing protein [Pseudomonadota bacterium]MBU1419554.1 PilZ domain-containing protein [Pseudomonadota bacterium]MBU1456582.1 PilZ domain-containing protein [Pseudomonadota bacterium]